MVVMKSLHFVTVRYIKIPAKSHIHFMSAQCEQIDKLRIQGFYYKHLFFLLLVTTKVV